MTDASIPSTSLVPRSAPAASRDDASSASWSRLRDLVWRTTGNVHDCPGMVQGIAQVGRDMPSHERRSLPWHVGGMMVAMMFPTIAPIVCCLIVGRAAPRRRPGADVAFNRRVPRRVVVNRAHPPGCAGWFGTSRTGPRGSRAPGGVLVIAGWYQFTSWKMTCLKACRSPLSFL